VVEAVTGDGHGPRHRPSAVREHLRRHEPSQRRAARRERRRPATYAQELDRAVFADLINRYPGTLLNISRVLVDLSAWPSSEAPPRPTYRKTAAHKVARVIETLMMLYIGTSIREASQADIVLTPRFTTLKLARFLSL
jgi:hypothetical protein